MQSLNANRAEAWLNLGVLDPRLGNFAPAEAAYQRAIRMEPLFIPPYVNLADVYRQQGREAEGERVVRQALSMHPPNGDVHHGECPFRSTSWGQGFHRRRRRDRCRQRRCG